jgi:predicted ATPase
MRVSDITFKNFKRFTDLRIQGLPESARLVVVTGANGTGKSAVFEGFSHARRSSYWGVSDATYFNKLDVNGEAPTPGVVTINFFGNPTVDLKQAIWVRSAHRHESDFQNTSIAKQQSAIEDPGLHRMIEGDQLVSINYSRLASSSLEALYRSENRDVTAGEITDSLIGPLQQAMRAIFTDLELNGVADPLTDGTFFFNKGASNHFAFKNLSSGERAAFDLLLDMLVRTKVFNDTVYCIDEPELHLNSKVQGSLLVELLGLLPDTCQLWIATHSPGMMKKAIELHRGQPDTVCFIDTYGKEFDGPVVLEPIVPSRAFWRRSLEVALDDMASLVAPEVLVLCEGDNIETGFDATCYRTIFQQHHDAQFVSVGNATEVKRDSQGIAAAVQVVAPGTRIIKVIDRDDLTEAEIRSTVANGTRVLSVRNIEGYLLDDELLHALYRKYGHQDGATAVVEKATQIAAAHGRGAPPDDYKKIAPNMKTWIARSLGISQPGSTAAEFLRTFIVPLVVPGTNVYQRLESDIFDT